MLPVITIIGRPNVGKSTLFNRLTKSKSALVLDLPGTTRDRNYGFGKIGEQPYIVIDTAGIDDDADEQNKMVISQVKKAIIEANIVLFMVDAAMGLMAADLDLAEQLRKFSKKIIVVINKIDGVNINLVASDFFRLGFNNIAEISAKANRGINKLAELFTNAKEFSSTNNQQIPQFDDYIKVAIIGQPNVGKSTLVNKILGEERVIVLDSPGTTRDSIYIPTQVGAHKYMLIDTAGVRRKARVKDTLEKFSVIKTLQAIEDAQIVVLLIDAQKGIVDQDLKLISCIIDAGRSLVLAINKWDMVNKHQQQALHKKLKAEISFIEFIQPIPISALHGVGIQKMFKATLEAFKSATTPIATNKLSLLLQQAIEQHQPPLSSNGRRIKLRYAHLGGHLPFKIIIHGNQVKSLPKQYKKYLSSFYQEKLHLSGTIVNIELKNTDNPYI